MLTINPPPPDFFWLGTHMPEWAERTDVPLFLSARRLRVRRLPRARGAWALDSGGFSELSLHGIWQTTPGAYVAEVRRWRDEVGGLQWAAAQDWMCEPFLVARTGLSVKEHQRRTVANYRILCELAPEIPWVPVLQGWHPDDYLRHLDLYDRALKEPLAKLPLVGLGSVCRRQATGGIATLVQQLHGWGIKLHGFGIKLRGLVILAPYLHSADSMAWSYWYRKVPARKLPGCTHRTCANCLPGALAWRQRLLQRVTNRRECPC